MKKLVLLATLLLTFAAHAVDKTETAIYSGGCFWGMEEVFRKVPGVVSTKVGYTGGTVANPNYEQVSSGKTGHAESIQIEFDPKKISYENLTKMFFRMHDPTSLNRQGNDIGTQYRSAIYTTDDAQQKAAERSKELYQRALSAHGHGAITTEIAPAGEFYFAEDYHQQYLAKNPAGYCGLGGSGVACPIGVGL